MSTQTLEAAHGGHLKSPVPVALEEHGESFGDSEDTKAFDRLYEVYPGNYGHWQCGIGRFFKQIDSYDDWKRRDNI